MNSRSAKAVAQTSVPGDDTTAFRAEFAGLPAHERRWFGDVDRYVTFRRDMRAELGQPPHRGVRVTALKQAWEANRPNEHGVSLRDEFAGDFEAYEAYCKHEAAGDITICARASTTAARRDIRGVAMAGDERSALRQETAAGADGTVTALKRAWDLNRPNERGVPVQDEFGGDYETFCAYRLAELQGLVSIAGERKAVSRPESTSVCVTAGDEAAWRSAFGRLSPTEQTAFGDLDTYVAFKRQEKLGNVTILAPGAA